MALSPRTRRSVFVTGASSGIGAALALELAARGDTVWLGARRLLPLQELVARIQAAGGQAHAVVIDVADVGCVRDTLMRIDDEAGGLDVVVANAGVAGEHLSAWSGDVQDAALVIGTNVTGAVATLMTLLPRMKARRRGQLVGISSLAAEVPLPLGALYGASKAALSFWLDALAPELEREGVVVTIVHPGFVRSPMNANKTFVMPFLQETGPAAALIADAIDQGRSWLRFPWPLALLSRLAAWLPRRWRAAGVRKTHASRHPH